MLYVSLLAGEGVVETHTTSESADCNTLLTNVGADTRHQADNDSLPRGSQPRAFTQQTPLLQRQWKIQPPAGAGNFAGCRWPACYSEPMTVAAAALDPWRARSPSWKS